MPPLSMGTSKAVVRNNVREFHSGPTYAKTKRKFGSMKANKQAVAVAMNQKRKSRRSGY